jgi:hypothetical protein
MLFVLSDEIAPVCLEAGGANIEGIQNLLLAVRRGDHALSASRTVLQNLSANAALGERERATASYLLNRRMELHQLERLVSRKVIIHSREGFPSLRKIGDTWELAASELAEKFTGKIAILAENMIDAELYALAAEHYRISQHIKGIAISSVQRGGGGSQLDVELKSNLRTGQTTIAVSDGDKKYPSQAPGDVAKRCVALVNSAIGVGWHAGIDCYAAECLIPVDVYANACAHDDRHSEVDRINKLDALGQKPSDYFSWKSGISLSHIFNFVDEQMRSYWLDVSAKLSKTRPAMTPCLEAAECSTDPCDCVLSKGFGDASLRLVRDWVALRSHRESFFAFRNAEKWLSLGKIVFEVGLALPRQRI